MGNTTDEQIQGKHQKDNAVGHKKQLLALGSTRLPLLQWVVEDVGDGVNYNEQHQKPRVPVVHDEGDRTSPQPMAYREEIEGPADKALFIDVQNVLLLVIEALRSGAVADGGHE